MSVIPLDVILAWPSTVASIPSGWARETTLDGKYPKGAPAATNPNSTGGAANHSHTSPAHSHTIANHTHTYSLGSIGGGAGASSSSPQSITEHHTHTGTSGAANGGTTSSDTGTYGSVSNDPPFYEVVFIKSAGGILANGIMAYFADTSIPSGWQNSDGTNSTPDVRNKYLKGAGTGNNAGATGGSTTNVHPLNHTHTANSHTHDAAPSNVSPSTRVGDGTSNLVDQNHTHNVSLNAGTQNINAAADLTTTETVEPLHKKLLAIYKVSGGPAKPKGLIGMWLGALTAIPAGWNLCDGTLGTPDLRDYYAKCANDTSQIGNTGGANTHTHGSQTHIHTGNGSHTHTANVPAHVNFGSPIRAEAASSTLRTQAGQVHPSTVDVTTADYNPTSTTADEASNEPLYRTVAYIQFDKELGGSFLYNFL